WIEAGVAWPDEGTGPPTRRTELTVTDDDRRHWAFRPLAKVEPPAVKDAGKDLNALDRFILAGLEAKRLTPAPPADARVLIRRVTYDVIGLPPTPEEVEAFVKATDRDAA